MSLNSPASSPRPTRSPTRWVTDLALLVLLPLIVLDVLPCTPPGLRSWLAPLLGTLGLWQGPWTLFAPIPDSQNHRIRAELIFEGSSPIEWNSPDWRRQSTLERFLSHRDSEFFERIANDSNSRAWPDFAMSLASSLSPDRPERLRLFLTTCDIPPPSGDWSVPPIPMESERLLFTLIFPPRSTRPGMWGTHEAAVVAPGSAGPGTVVRDTNRLP